MYRPALFITQAIVILVVAALHLSAMEWYLYWYFPWLDLLTHFLGGLWIALASAWLLAYVGQKVSAVRIIALAMFIGVCWEVFEFMAGIPREANFMFDTSLDLIMDFCGGVIGFLIARHMVQSDSNGEATQNNPSEPSRTA